MAGTRALTAPGRGQRAEQRPLSLVPGKSGSGAPTLEDGFSQNETLWYRTMQPSRKGLQRTEVRIREDAEEAGRLCLPRRTPALPVDPLSSLCPLLRPPLVST